MTDPFSEDSYLADEAETMRTVQRIQTLLPQELKDKLSEDDLLYLYDCLIEYVGSEDFASQTLSDDGYIDIDQEEIANALLQTAQKEQYKTKGEVDKEGMLLFVDIALEQLLGEGEEE